MKWSDAAGRWAGDRRFSSRKADCAELASSMMFSAAVQIQLLASLAPPSSPNPPAAPASPGPGTPAAAAPAAAESPRPPADPEVSPSPPADDNRAPPPPVAPIEPAPAPASPSPPVTLGAGVGAGVAVGVGPAPGALARLFIGARRGRLSLEVGADSTLPVSDQQSDGSGFALDTQAAGGVGCGHLGVVAGCVVGRFGRIHARGSGIDAPRSPSGLFSQVGARLAVGGDVGGRFFAGAHVDGLVMLAPWTVRLNGGDVWATPRFAVLFGVDVGARFF